MNGDEFRLALAYAIGLNKHSTGDIAMLWEENQLVTIQAAPKVNTTETGLALPIVRLLRNRGERLARGFIISTTAPPTEACLGMARMCGIHYIVYLSGGQVCQITTSRKRTTLRTSAMSYNGPIANVTGVRGSTTVYVPWHNPPATYTKHLKDWVDRLAAQNTTEGAAAAAAKALPLDGPPGGSTFASSGLEYLRLKTIVPDQTVLDNVLMMIAFEMVGQVSGFSTSDKGVVSRVGGQRSGSHAGQNIGSLLSDADGNVVSWGFNTNKENSTRHGETNLVSSYLADNPGQGLPNGGTIYTTLEPCEMCSGAIVRTVKAGHTLRVIYGQKDDNVSSTALQRKAHAGVTMTASGAGLVTARMIHEGSGLGVTRTLTSSMTEEQKRSGLIETTKFLKTQGTYQSFFGSARPNWWLYLWDYMTSRLSLTVRNSKEKGSTLLADQAVMKAYADLEIIYMLVEQFMKAVRTQAVA